MRLFQKGETQGEVARRLGVSRQTALRWARAWERDGVQGLRAAGRAGRKPKVSAKQLEQIEQALLEGPAALGYVTEIWTLPRIAELIERITGVHYHPGHVWRLMGQLGWSIQKPTTRARERDEAAISRWKKLRWPALKKTLDADARRSSLSTRAASPSGPPSGVRGRRAVKRPS